MVRTKEERVNELKDFLSKVKGTADLPILRATPVFVSESCNNRIRHSWMVHYIFFHDGVPYFERSNGDAQLFFVALLGNDMGDVSGAVFSDSLKGVLDEIKGYYSSTRAECIVKRFSMSPSSEGIWYYER